MVNTILIKNSDVKLNHDEIGQILEIHYKHFPGNISKLEKKFLKKVYQNVLIFPKNFVTILKNNEKILGFALFSINNEKSNFLFFKKNFFYLIYFTIISIFSLRIFYLIQLFFESNATKYLESKTELYFIAVDKKYKYQGYGGKLIKISENYLKSLNTKNFIVRTHYLNDIANSFYFKYGFNFLIKKNKSNIYIKNIK